MLFFRFCCLWIAATYGFTFRGHTFRRSTASTVPFFTVDYSYVSSYGSKKELTALRSVGNQAIDDNHVVEKESLLWKTPGYRRPLHWVQKVSHLEDTLQFYQSNFNFKVYRHEEFSSGCEATCNGPYGGAWSKTMVGPEPGEGLSFCLELVFNYGVNRYERGNDLRSMAIKSSAFVGNKDLIGVDSAGRKFIETPDGHWIKLVDSGAANEGASDQRDCVESVALHVTDLASSVKFYSQVLGASVVVNPDGISASCVWKSASSGKSNGVNRSAAQTGIVLFQLEEGKKLEFEASQGRFAIETEDGAQEKIAVRARAAEEEGSGRVVHGPVKLEPHGEEVLIVRDEDGHEYCFVDARGFQRCVDVSKKQVRVVLDC
jgi:catechol 2,3-dioxygenase-like lactoylglutathione lyase family enzyme